MQDVEVDRRKTENRAGAPSNLAFDRKLETLELGDRPLSMDGWLYWLNTPCKTTSRTYSMEYIVYPPVRSPEVISYRSFFGVSPFRTGLWECLRLYHLHGPSSHGRGSGTFFGLFGVFV